LLSAAFIFSAVAVLFFAYLTFQHLLNGPTETAEASGIVIDSNDALAPVTGLPPQITVTQTAISLAPTPAPIFQPWEGKERVNILLMGIDRRPGEGFVSRTDTMMVISVDPQTDSAAILSIPRDLYVDIPGYGQDRINTAFVLGAINSNDIETNYLDGAALAMQTVSYNLDIPINHFVLVDFSAFTRTIDLLGGIDLTVPYTIDDPLYPDMNYGYDPLYIEAGPHHFDGQMALKYARTRHADTDFNRAARQQQVLLGVRQKALGMGVTELLRNAPALYREIDSGVRTDMSFEQLLRLATTGTGIPSDNIQNAVLDQTYLTSYLTPGGASVYLMNPDLVMPLIRSLFG
jgi:LCP family protein required for cell wall assembly